MARTNRECAAWVIELLDVGPDENVLEVGFGPGVGIQLLAKRAAAGYVAGIGRASGGSERGGNQTRSRRLAARLGGELAVRGRHLR